MVGERLLSVVAAGAAVTTKVIWFDVPPPGVGVNTVTGIVRAEARSAAVRTAVSCVVLATVVVRLEPFHRTDRKSTRLNSSHVEISYAVFCLKKKKRKTTDK